MRDFSAQDLAAYLGPSMLRDQAGFDHTSARRLVHLNEGGIDVRTVRASRPFDPREAFQNYVKFLITIFVEILANSLGAALEWRNETEPKSSKVRLRRFP